MTLDDFSCGMPRQLVGLDEMVNWITEMTGRSSSEVWSRLSREGRRPGTNVREELRRTGVRPHVWSAEMGRFYEESDALIYELLLWNLGPAKCRMRTWIARYLVGRAPERRLCWLLGTG